MTDSKDELDCFYEILKKGTTIEDFLGRYDLIIQFVISKGWVADFRLAKGRLKKLRDEIAPVVCFVRVHAASQDRIQFALDDDAIDCNVWHGSTFHRKIQVTVAQAKERLYLMTELNERGSARGHLGLTDDRKTQDFCNEMNREMQAYSTQQAQDTIVRAVGICLENKKYNSGADTLIIGEPLDEKLPTDRWLEIKPRLSESARVSAASSLFSEIFVVGPGDGAGICFQIWKRPLTPDAQRNIT